MQKVYGERRRTRSIAATMENRVLNLLPHVSVRIRTGPW